MAKDVLKFRGLNGKGAELQIGLSLLYYVVTFDQSILLSNDKKQL